MVIKATMKVSKDGEKPKTAIVSMDLSQYEAKRLMRLWMGGMKTWTFDDCCFLDWIFGIMDRITRKNGKKIVSTFAEMKLEERG